MGEFVIGIGIIVMFVMQLLCFRIRKPWGRWIPLALILPRVTNDVMGIYWAEPISDALSATTCGIVFACSIRKILKQ